MFRIIEKLVQKKGVIPAKAGIQLFASANDKQRENQHALCLQFWDKFPTSILISTMLFFSRCRSQLDSRRSLPRAPTRGGDDARFY